MSTTRVFVCLAMAVMLATSLGSVAQIAEDTFQVSYFSNATSTRYGDQVIRIVNPGLRGSPLTTTSNPNVCANLYIFDAEQTMQACCSCKIVPNGMVTLSLTKNLLLHPVNGSIPASGVIKLVSSSLPSGTSPTSCDPSSYAPAANLRATMEHLELIKPTVLPFGSLSTPFISLAAFEPSELSGYEFASLLSGCMNIHSTNACTCGT